MILIDLFLFCCCFMSFLFPVATKWWDIIALSNKDTWLGLACYHWSLMNDSLADCLVATCCLLDWWGSTRGRGPLWFHHCRRRSSRRRSLLSSASRNLAGKASVASRTRGRSSIIYTDGGGLQLQYVFKLRCSRNIDFAYCGRFWFMIHDVDSPTRLWRLLLLCMLTMPLQLLMGQNQSQGKKQSSHLSPDATFFSFFLYCFFICSFNSC